MGCRHSLTSDRRRMRYRPPHLPPLLNPRLTHSRLHNLRRRSRLTAAPRRRPMRPQRMFSQRPRRLRIAKARPRKTNVQTLVPTIREGRPIAGGQKIESSSNASGSKTSTTRRTPCAKCRVTEQPIRLLSSERTGLALPKNGRRVPVSSESRTARLVRAQTRLPVSASLEMINDPRQTRL